MTAATRRARILFGGSFDPPTVAHRRLVEIALAAVPDGELVVIPAGSPPHKRDRAMTAPELRLRMAEIAFEALERVRVSDEECRRPGLSYTVDTLLRHRAELADGKLYLLIGSDSLLDLPGWREPNLILRLARVLTVPRPGFAASALDALPGLDDAQRAALHADILKDAGPPVSSSGARERLARGEDASALVDPAVLAFIRREGLYAAGGG